MNKRNRLEVDPDWDPEDLDRPLTSRIKEDEGSLYFILRNGHVPIQNVVDNWIRSYETDARTASLQIQQLFISSSGCQGTITPSMFAQMETSDIIVQMTDAFGEEGGRYPLVTPGQVWKRFRSNFSDFIQQLILQCQNQIIFDQEFMDKIMSLLTQLSDSQVRAFRHTATLGSMKLMTALVDVFSNIEIKKKNTQRQINAEKNKFSGTKIRVSDRLEALETQEKELVENGDRIKLMHTYLFKAIFVHRYRDISQDIRSICMYEMGQWMQKNSSMYLNDAYLKYIGWTVYDKTGDVRLKCLQALQPLYKEQSLTDKLELFTKKFKDRIIQLNLDKEPEVAIEAVKLSTSILRNSPDLLEDKDKEQIYELVYCSHPGLAKAAGDFLNACLFSDTIKSEPDGGPNPNRKEHLRDVVQFFMESELHEHGAYLVDALIESNSMMKDWQCMTDLLLQDPGAGEEAMESEQETKLIEIMVCCIRQASTGEPPIGRGNPSRKGLSPNEQRQVNEDKNGLSTHFIETLNRLVRKFSTEDAKIVNLITIPQYFSLEMYTSGRHEDNLKVLLELIKEIVKTRSDKEVLEACAKTLDMLCNDNDHIASQCNTSRATLLEWIGNRFKIVTSAYMDNLKKNEEPTEDEMFHLVSIMKKIEVFSNAHDMKECQIWDEMFDILSQYLAAVLEEKEMKLPVEAVKSCVLGCYYGLIWDKYRLENCEQRGQTIKATDVQNLQDNFNSYLTTMKQMINMNITGPGCCLKEESFVSICDLLIFFSNEKLKKNGMLSQLFYEPDENLPTELNIFVQTNVFVPDDEDAEDEQDDHKKIEELHKRRNFLSCFCKLIVYSVIPMQSAADVFKHYSTFYNDFGDIIKETLRKSKTTNKVNLAKTLAYSLINKYKEGVNSNEGMDRGSDKFAQLKELAKKLASKEMPFGADPIKNRHAVTELHREGILFAITPLNPSGAPPNLPFLEVLTEFTSKLLKNPKVDDRKVVAEYLDARSGFSDTLSYDSDWNPLITYRNSLTDGRIIPTDGIRGNKNNFRINLEDSDDDELEILADKGPVGMSREFDSDDDDDLEVVREIPLGREESNKHKSGRSEQIKREKQIPESTRPTTEEAQGGDSDDDLEIVLEKETVTNKRSLETDVNLEDNLTSLSIKSETGNTSKRQKEGRKDCNDNNEDIIPKHRIKKDTSMGAVNEMSVGSGDDSGIHNIKDEVRSNSLSQGTTSSLIVDECVTLD